MIAGLSMCLADLDRAAQVDPIIRSIRYGFMRYYITVDVRLVLCADSLSVNFFPAAQMVSYNVSHFKKIICQLFSLDLSANPDTSI